MIATLSKVLIMALIACFAASPSVPIGQFSTHTPCHDELRQLHNIPAGVDCSVIKWNLILNGGRHQSFSMTSEWGYYVDNRTLEIRGHADASGKWTLDETRAFPVITINGQNGTTASFRLLDSNHLHVLDASGKLLNGNGGWSFTLNRSSQTNPAVPTKTQVTAPYRETFTSKTFHGRTPCREISTEANIATDPTCFKLKWLLRLYQDSVSLIPSHYELQTTYHRASILRGKWEIYSAVVNNRQEIIYELDPDKRDKSIRLMKGDDNLLFFLDKNLVLLPGGTEFGYTLNRR
ncbi:MAG TPA: hypothetical protein VGD65_01960 [Chryseosolibacter sp.]